MKILQRCAHNHYYLVVIDFTKNEGHVIDGLDRDQAYNDEREYTYKER